MPLYKSPQEQNDGLFWDLMSKDPSELEETLAGLNDPTVPGLDRDPLPEPDLRLEEVSSQLPFFPTGQILNDPKPGFTSSDITRAQKRAYKASLTSTDNIVRDLYSAGKIDEAREAVSDAEGGSFLEGLFDVLQADQFAITGFLDEYIKTGSWDKAFAQAAVEIGNAAPGIDLRQARRLGWSDIIKHSDKLGIDFFDESATGRYAASVLGFFGDIFLSPLTYTGFGLGKVFQAARRAGGTAAATDFFAKRGIPGADTFGEMFIPNYKLRQFGIRELGGDPKAYDEIVKSEEGLLTIKNYLEKKAAYYADVDLGAVEIGEVAKDLRSVMTTDEAHLATLFMDQGDEAFTELMRLYATRSGQLDRFPEIMENANAFRDMWFVEGVVESSEGVISQGALRAWDNYVPARLPTDRKSGRIFREFISRGQVNEFINFEDLKSIAPGAAKHLENRVTTLHKNPTFTYAKMTENILERVTMGHPTELDIGKVAMKRGLESNRALASKRLLDSVFSDPSIVRKFDKEDGGRLLKDRGFLSEMQKRGYVIMDPKEIKRLSKEDESGEMIQGVFSSLVMDKPGLVMMPEAIFNDLKKAQNFFTNAKDETKGFFRTFQQVQGLWKGYALLSPGYLMRNNQGNAFNNWLAGVTNPKRYAMSMALQAGGTENLPAIVRQATEGLLGGPLRLDDVWMKAGGRDWTGHDLMGEIHSSNIFNTGVFTKDLATDTERGLLTSLDRHVRKARLAKLSKGATALRGALTGGGVAEDQAEATARLWDATAESWSVNEGRSIDDFYDQYGPKIQFMNENQFKPEKGIPHLFKVEEEVFTASLPGGPIGLPFGDVERALHKAFQNNPYPTSKELQDALGVPVGAALIKGSILELEGAVKASASRMRVGPETGGWAGVGAPQGVPAMAHDFRDLEEVYDLAHKMTTPEQRNWYAEYGQEISNLIGTQNMGEFSSVWSILSPRRQVEDNTADALVVMRTMREIFQGKWKKGVYNEAAPFKGEMDWDEFDRLLRPWGKKRGTNPQRVKAQIRKVDHVRLDPDGKDALGAGKSQLNGLMFSNLQADALRELYENGIFRGQFKTESFVMNTYQQAKGAGFFPFPVNDVHIARLFGIAKNPVRDKDTGKMTQEFNFDTASIKGRQVYRWVSYQLAELARRKNVSPDEVQATLWAYSKRFLSPKSEAAESFGKGWRDEVGEPGAWDSTREFARAEFIKLANTMKSLGKREGSYNRSFRGLADVDVQYSKGKGRYPAYPLTQDWAVKMGERIVNITPSRGAMGVKGVLPSPVGEGAEESMSLFWDEAINKVTTRDNTKIKALKELEEEWQFTHHIQGDTKASVDGLEPDMAVVIRANDDATADAVAAIVADGFRKDNFEWHRAQLLTANEAKTLVDENPLLEVGGALRIRRADADGRIGDPFDEATLSRWASKGLDFHMPTTTEIRAISREGETNAAFMKRVNAIVKDDPNVRAEGYTHVRRTAGREEYGRAMQRVRMGLAGGEAGSSSVARRIHNSFHAKFDGVLNSHATANKWRVEARDDRALTEGLASKLGDQPLLEQRHGTAAKGVVQFREEGRDVITLFENHDFSTIVHESAHIWRRRAIGGEDLTTIEKWAKVKDGKWTVAQEERFARGFERYLREGVSPTAALGNVFAKAKDWMSSVYSTLTGSKVNVRISDEMRDVFNRMLGSGHLDPLGKETEGVLEDVASLTGKPETAGDYIDQVGGVLARYLGPHAPHMVGFRALGRAQENNARGAHFLDKLEKTGDPQTAIASMNKYLFDYENGLTDWEQEYARTVIPFYAWMRFNIPLQIQSMLEDPGRYAKIPKFMDAVEDVTAEWRDIPTPDYYTDLHAVRLPIIMKGKPTYLNPNLPFQDLNRMNWKDILSSMTPFVRLFGEMIPQRGYSVFMDRPLEKYPDEPSAVMPFLSKKQEHIAMALLPTYGKIQRAVKAGQRDELWAQALTELAGVKLMNVDKQRVLTSQAHAKKRVLQELKNKLEDRGEIAKKKKPRRGGRRRRRRTRGGEGEVARRLLEE